MLIPLIQLDLKSSLSQLIPINKLEILKYMPRRWLLGVLTV